MKSLTRGNLKAGLDSVRGAKLRSFWTMLGVVIGVASVISVVSIGEGVKQQVGGQIHHLGKDLIAVRPAQLQTGNSAGALSGLSVSDTITQKDVAAIAHVKGVSASAPLALVTGTIKAPLGTYKNGMVLGTSYNLSGLLNQSIAYGSFLTEDDMGVNSAVLGQDAAEQMFDENVPLGRSFTFHGQEFVVRGIFNQFASLPLNQQVNLNNAIFIPYDVAEQITKGTAPTFQLLARASDQKQTGAVAAAIKHQLDRNHGGQSNFNVQDANQSLASSESVLDLLTRLVASIAAISLLVGGIGIMNVMLVSVAERTHEIGIRKAIGATNRQILNQFIVEATVLSLAGGLIGIIVAFIIDGFLRTFTDLRPSISLDIVVLATAVSLLIGIIFGSIPALNAARKNPIDALRAQ